MRKINTLERSGAIEVGDREAVELELAGWDSLGHGDAPALLPRLVSVYRAWELLGRAISTIEGMAGGGIDNRAALYRARILWFAENGITSSFVRDLLLDLWRAMDDEDIACVSERMDHQAKG
jgi:hypothetical protein